MHRNLDIKNLRKNIINIHIQNPKVSLKNFDFIIAPDHDEIEGQNVLISKGAIHYLTLEEIKETSKLCRDVISNKKVIEILRTLQQNDVVCLSSQIIFKEAYSAYCSQAWNPHQDNRYIDNKNNQYITVNWFLKMVNQENGGLYIYPGSHKLSILPAPDKKSYRENPDDNPGRECEIPEEFLDKKIDLLLNENSVVFLHGNTIHGSYANNSDRSRPWYSTCYITKGEYYNIGKSSKRIPIEFE